MYYSATSANDHLFTTASSLQRPLYFVPADSPYIYSFLNLSTTQRPLKRVPSCQSNLDNGQFFQRLASKSRMVMKFDPCSALMINRGTFVH